MRHVCRWCCGCSTYITCVCVVGVAQVPELEAAEAAAGAAADTAMSEVQSLRAARRAALYDIELQLRLKAGQVCVCACVWHSREVSSMSCGTWYLGRSSHGARATCDEHLESCLRAWVRAWLHRPVLLCLSAT